MSTSTSDTEAHERVLTSDPGVQFGGDEVVKAKDGAGSATLSMAYAGYRFAERVMQAAKGKSGVVEPTFVYLPGVDGGDEIKKATGCDYFSVPVELGPQGAVKVRLPAQYRWALHLRYCGTVSC